MQTIKLLGSEWASEMTKDIKNAKSRVCLTAMSCQQPHGEKPTPYHVLYNAIKAAARRGVHVDVWLPDSHTAHPATLKNRNTAANLAAAGVIVHLVRGGQLLHAKTCAIDDEIAWVGSGNLTAAASHHNYEAFLRAVCPNTARNIRARWELLA